MSIMVVINQVETMTNFGVNWIKWASRASIYQSMQVENSQKFFVSSISRERPPRRKIIFSWASELCLVLKILNFHWWLISIFFTFITEDRIYAQFHSYMKSFTMYHNSRFSLSIGHDWIFQLFFFYLFWCFQI